VIGQLPSKFGNYFRIVLQMTKKLKHGPFAVLPLNVILLSNGNDLGTGICTKFFVALCLVHAPLPLVGYQKSGLVCALSITGCYFTTLTLAPMSSKASDTGDRDELTSTAFEAVQSLSATRKASLLLDTSLSLIEAGQYVVIYHNFLSKLFLPGDCVDMALK
jgi:hypothetical protein